MEQILDKREKEREEREIPFKKIAIIGVGLIGGSLGLAIKRLSHPPQVIGVARHQKTLDKALEKGAIHKGTISLKDGVAQADLVFVATPVGTIVEIVKEISPYLKAGAIITDVGSTKSNIIFQIEEFLPGHLKFIGGHPMTGSEHQGVEYADASLFENSYYILTPTPKTDTEAFRHLHSLLSALGANVLAVDGEKHDKIVATVSHLPHVIASTLMNLALRQAGERENLLLLAAGGFRDTTRIAASNWEMWLDICFENREAILEDLEEFQLLLREIFQLIKDKDRQGLKRNLEQARLARISMPSLVKKDLSQLRELLIPVIDRPGVISDITLALGKIGLNIEDIEILHSSEVSGILRLTVAGEKESLQAAQALREQGYKVEVRPIYQREG